ncbi:MAG: type IV pilus modification PilV family protein [bacterium]
MKGHQDGVSLIEILAATFLISIAIIPILAIYPDTLGTGRETESDLIIGAAAVRKMEEIIGIQRVRPVSFDATASAGSANAVLSTSNSLAIGSGANYFVILIGVRATTTTVSSVNVGGTLATRLLFQNHPSVARRAEFWWLQNPPTGTVTVTVTMTGSIRHVWVAATFKNVDAATPLGSSIGATGNSTTPGVTINPRAANSTMIGGFYWNAAAPTITQGGGQTSIGTVGTSGTSITSTHLARETTEGAAGIDLTWTNSGGAQNWVAIAAELRSTIAVGLPNGSATCTDLPNCLLVWTTTTELSSATEGIGTLSTLNVVACQDTNGNSACDAVERQVRYDAKVTTRP